MTIFSVFIWCSCLSCGFAVSDAVWQFALWFAVAVAVAVGIQHRNPGSDLR